MRRKPNKPVEEMTRGEQIVYARMEKVKARLELLKARRQERKVKAGKKE